jgi:hypothetical protein
MAALTVQTVTAAGITPAAPVQITAWSGTGDTISSSEIGQRGVWAEVSNASGGSLDFRIEDSGSTPAGNTAANGYRTVTVPTGQSRKVFIGRHNVNSATSVVKVGASTSHASFTVGVFRY